MIGPGPRIRRATGSGRSSCPRWSTSAPAARATSARSLTASSALCLRQASANTSSSASSSPASRPFSRSWTMSTPPPRTASRNSGRSPWARRASVHRYSRASASRNRNSVMPPSCRTGPGPAPVTMGLTTTGALRGAEREATRLRPLNLIRVMPAKGGEAATDADVIVVGGGVIGTAIAWRAARAGHTVTIIDPGTDDKASLVAAGMLGPVSESVFGEQDLLTLNLHAIGRFPSFNAELEEAAGSPTGLPTEGTPAGAYNHAHLTALDRLTEFRHSIGLA